jgi:hypothetical protein
VAASYRDAMPARAERDQSAASKEREERRAGRDGGTCGKWRLEGYSEMWSMRV